MFTVGFALREYGAFHFDYNTTNLNVYIASTCLIYMAPYVWLLPIPLPIFSAICQTEPFIGISR